MRSPNRNGNDLVNSSSPKKGDLLYYYVRDDHFTVDLIVYMNLKNRTLHSIELVSSKKKWQGTSILDIKLVTPISKNIWLRDYRYQPFPESE